MKNIFKDLQKGLTIGFGIMLMVGIIGGAYAALSTLKVSDTDPLTSTLWNNLVDHSVPSTAIMAFNSTTCPVGWSQADGTNGNPDLRGQFLRGLNSFDNGTTTRSDGNEDIDGASRVLGSFQADELKQHKHSLGTATISAGSSAYVAYPDGGLSRLRSNGVDSAGGTESRPNNIAVIYCIKD